MPLKFYIICLTVLSWLTAAAAPILDIDGEESTSIGIYIKDLTTGRVVVSHNASLALTPASVLKAVTTATALEKLGADFRFTTRVALAGKPGADRRSWEGDLVIFGSADPTLESDQFKACNGLTDSITAALRRRGITRITGSVVIVESLRDAGPIAQWEVEDIAWPYGAGLYGFNYAGNYVRVYPNKGTTSPASSLKIKVLPAAEADGNDLLRGAGADNLTVWATPRSRRDPNWSLNATVPDPAGVYAALLLDRLNAAGIRTGSRPANADRSDATTIYVHRSAPGAEIMANLMKRSDNLFAEGMLRAIDPGASRKDCIEAEKDFWAARGLNSRHTIIKDGSGLTRGNKLPPRFLGDVLEQMARGTNGATYASFFPRAGMEGTLKSFLKKTRLKGRLALKTGSVAAVQCYAGYRLDWEGKPTHVVVIMVNGFFCPRAQLRSSIEKFLLKTFE